MLHFIRSPFPVMYASSNSLTETTTEHMNEQKQINTCIDSERGAHIVLRNLKYDDKDAIKSANDQIALETGMDRLRQVFHTSNIGEQSEALSNIQTALKGVALVSIVAGTSMSMSGFQDEFKFYNKLTKFDTRISAVRRMNDHVYVRSFLEGCRWTFRLTFFTASFMCVSQAIAVYRNKSSGFEYSIGAAVTGGLLRFNMGLRATIAGSLIAGIMGLPVGLLIYGAQHVLDEKQDQRHFKETYKQQLYEIQLKRLATHKKQ